MKVYTNKPTKNVNIRLWLTGPKKAINRLLRTNGHSKGEHSLMTYRPQKGDKSPTTN